MWWILSALIALVVWTLWFVLGSSLSMPIAITSVIVLVNVARVLWGRIRATRASVALERAIAQQGEQQARNARPERRAEIQALQKQIQRGIQELETSKLGKGKRRGTALYSLPWYIIIGPPGAGKTTALVKSGLVFPFADPRGCAGVRGVGGTRNCDWWFTNEAILLDTAGRYATDIEDRDEWLAFLGLLKKHRSRLPINGVIVAVSVAEIIDAREQQIEATGKKLRARIDEVMTQLEMVVPVYLLLTKCDLIAGFVEFFGGMRRSERAQAWGATLALNEDRTDPGALLERELDVLVERVHVRALQRCAQERNREARSRIYQFPLELACIRRNLTDLVRTVFTTNAFQRTPVFRGFYLTSGTQEGRPLDRALERMSHAMGIRPPEAAMQQVTESKSYFLHDVFKNVVFPDRDIAARSAAELRRQAIVCVAASVTAAFLGLVLLAASTLSFDSNRRLLRDGEALVREAMNVDWTDGRSPESKLERLDPLLAFLDKLDGYRTSGAPMELACGMYRGEAIRRPLLDVYVSLFQQGFLAPCRAKLESQLLSAKGGDYLRERTDLKTYLMMSDVEHLDVEWEATRLTRIYVDISKPTSNVRDRELEERIARHVKYYLRLIKNGIVPPLQQNGALVENVRGTLQAVPVRKRYYALFVDRLIDDRRDEVGDVGDGNRRFPPLDLYDIFRDRPDVPKIITGARPNDEDGRRKRIDGPYTDDGRYRVLVNVENGIFLLESEQWVVPLGPDERHDRLH